MRTIDRTIDHRTLRSLVNAGTTVGAEVVGKAGVWGLIINYGRASQTLAAARGGPRTFRRFETLAGYLKEVGITDVRVNLAKYETGAKGPADKRSVTAAERMRSTHAAADYDKWFRTQVQAALDDPHPSIPDAEVRTRFAAKREALRARSKASH